MMITSVQNERVKHWVSLKDKKYRDLSREYLIEGEHLVQEAYKNGYLKTIICTNDIKVEYGNVEIIQVTDNIMKKISSTNTPQKIAGIAKYFEENNDNIFEKIVILDGVQDPGNAGTIVRNSLAFGYNLVFFSTDSVDIYNSKFIRATQGYFYSLKIARGEVEDFIKYLKGKDIQIISTFLDKNSKNISSFIPDTKHCLVFGNEGKGVSKKIIDLSDIKLVIKMNEKVDSLNVSVASGIVMYDFNNKLLKM